jgi:hypothetical protein
VLVRAVWFRNAAAGLTCRRRPRTSTVSRKVAGEPVSRILSAAFHARFASGAFRKCSAAIIPLGPESLWDSSSLPEGCSASLFERSAYGPGRPSPPIWPCSTRGFPCPGCCHPGGGLLPHLFTLAKCARPKQASPRFFLGPAAEVQASPAVCFLWHFP